MFGPPSDALWRTSWLTISTVGSAPLRQQVPIVLQDLVNTQERLILFEGEYRLQTPESIEWETAYRGRLSRMSREMMCGWQPSAKQL